MEDKKLCEMFNKVLDSLTDEQKEKAKDCNNVKELCDVLSKMGVALPDELLEAVSGGGGPYPGRTGVLASATSVCKKCGKPFSYFYFWTSFGDSPDNHVVPLYCDKCVKDRR